MSRRYYFVDVWNGQLGKQRRVTGATRREVEFNLNPSSGGEW